MFQSVLPVVAYTPAHPPVRKKSYISQFVTVTLLLAIAAEVVLPIPQMPFEGKFAPAAPILLLEIVMLSLPVVVPVQIQILPPIVASGVMLEPKTVQFVMVLFVASLMNCIVDVLAVAATLKLAIVNELPAAVLTH